MNLINLVLVLFCVKNIYCHGDTQRKPKVLLISFTNYKYDDILEHISTKFHIVELSLRSETYNKSTNLNSMITGCFPASKFKCEPIWVKNQRNDFDSAFINWSNQLSYNFSWPTYDYGCTNNNIALDLQLRRMLNWMDKPKTTLGFMYVDALTINISQFLYNASKLPHEKQMNIILISLNSTTSESKFLAMGPKFKIHFKSSVPIKLVDIYPIIDNILQLSDDKIHTDGNVTLASLLIKMSTSHIDLNIFQWATIGVIIAVSAVICCTIFIGAVKNTCGKVHKINHQYNLGMKNTSGQTGFPEHAYLLNGSDEDELFTDALPHVQTSKHQT